MLRAGVAFAGILLAGACATPSHGPSPDFAISLDHDVFEGRAVIVATVTNLTARPQCVRANAFRNPSSGEIDVWLRDGRGRTLPRYDVGMPPWPLAGELRIEPGQRLEGRSFLDPLYRLRNGSVPYPAGMSARVSFQYRACGHTVRRAAAPGSGPIIETTPCPAALHVHWGPTLRW